MELWRNYSSDSISLITKPSHLQSEHYNLLNGKILCGYLWSDLKNRIGINHYESIPYFFVIPVISSQTANHWKWQLNCDILTDMYMSTFRSKQILSDRSGLKIAFFKVIIKAYSYKDV